ncbi:hypothetical protein V1477_014275 [Vespula maculifrons]|uniref:Uncharacterized protein n=1 Tax=Vespula maculifrons TaxID=7453 RepID=A0ABD2BKL6_VESMC
MAFIILIDVLFFFKSILIFLCPYLLAKKSNEQNDIHFNIHESNGASLFIYSDIINCPSGSLGPIPKVSNNIISIYACIISKNADWSNFMIKEPII